MVAMKHSNIDEVSNLQVHVFNSKKNLHVIRITSSSSDARSDGQDKESECMMLVFLNIWLTGHTIYTSLAV